MSEIIHIKFEAYKPVVMKDVKPGNIVLYGENPNKPAPDYWISLYERSTKHRGIIDAKVRMVTGAGWKVDQSKTINQAQLATYNSMLRNANKNETQDEVWNKVNIDDEAIGAIALEIIYAEDGETIAEIYHVPVSRVRAYLDENENLKWIYIKDWRGQTKYDRIKEKAKENGFKEWWPFRSEKEKNPESQLLYLVAYRPVKSGETAYYGIPQWSGAIPWIECDIRTGNFHYNLIRNNFSGDIILNFNNGVPPTDEAKEKIASDFKKKFQGDDAKETGGVTIIFNKDKESAVTVTRMQAGDLDKKFLTLEEYTARNLRISHGGFPDILMGETKDGVFVNNNEQEAYESFNVRYVKPKQRYYEKIMNWIYGFDGVFKLNNKPPFRQKFSENIILENIDRDILKSMIYEQLGIDPEEIRKRIALSKSVNVEFEFSKIGEKFDSESQVIYEFGFKGDNVYSDDYYRGMAFASILDIEISKLQAEIISLVDSNPKISVPELSQALKVGESDVQEALDELLQKKAITGEPGKFRVTKSGKNTAKDQDYELETYVRYVYELAPDAPPLKPGGKSRQWCIDMMSKSASGIEYSRDQIDNISNSYGGSAWLFRGGPYRDPSGEFHEECRHRWKAVVRTRKKKKSYG